MWYHERYTPKPPIPVKDGVRVRGKKGAIGTRWWSKRWLAALESFGWSNRIERGRRYARQGQVADYRVAAGRVTASVQGTMPRPYTVTISLLPLTEAQWDAALAAMGSQALFSARLLAGELPEETEEVFREAGVPLFPEKPADLRMSCSCPDSAVPCKHIAAVFYVLADALDRDPFLIFSLRGMPGQEVLAALRERRCSAFSEQQDRGRGENPVPPAVTSRTDRDFWGAGTPREFAFDFSPPDVPAAILRNLGTPPFWDGDREFLPCMEEVYGSIASRARALAAGMREDGPVEKERKRRRKGRGGQG